MPNFAELPRHLVEQMHATVVQAPQVIAEATHASVGPSLLEGMRNLINWAVENPQWAAIPLLLISAIAGTVINESRRSHLDK